jgi:hypothetical protein
MFAKLLRRDLPSTYPNPQPSYYATDRQVKISVDYCDVRIELLAWGGGNLARVSGQRRAGLDGGGVDLGAEAQADAALIAAQALRTVHEEVIAKARTTGSK